MITKKMALYELGVFASDFIDILILRLKKARHIEDR